MPGSESPAAILSRVAVVLDGLAIAYAVGGSFASSLHGAARATRDADLIVDLDTARGERLADALEGDFYLSREAMRQAIRSRSTFNAIHFATAFKVDFFVLGERPFDLEEFRRRAPASLQSHGGHPISFKTAEDTILRKLEWFRVGGEVSDQQWRDVVAVLAVQGESLDGAYLERWAAELGVLDLLARARAELP